jgi:hypothetical protein
MTQSVTAAVQRLTRLTCPECGHESVETMPTNACVYFYECLGCGTLLRPKTGDCCVFCSFADTRCPPRQAQASDCCSLEGVGA